MATKSKAAYTRQSLEKLARTVAQREGIPIPLFLALITQESGWNPGAGSPAGARGLTQLMPGTARGLGVQDVSDPLQNLTGGARYLRQQLNRFGGNPKLALSAYNSGPGGSESAGRVENFPETQSYVQRVMALESQYGGEGAPSLSMTTSRLGTDAVQQEGGSNPLDASRGEGLPTLGELIRRVSPNAEESLRDRAGLTSPPDAGWSPPSGGVDAGAQATGEGLNAQFSQRITALIKAVRAAGGDLSIYSAGRSDEEQAQLYQAALQKYGDESEARKWVAPPGKSHHSLSAGKQYGLGQGALAADMRGDLAIAHKLAPRFGLVFPLSNEAWHIEYAGIRSMKR